MIMVNAIVIGPIPSQVLDPPKESIIFRVVVVRNCVSYCCFCECPGQLDLFWIFLLLLEMNSLLLWRFLWCIGLGVRGCVAVISGSCKSFAFVGPVGAILFTFSACLGSTPPPSWIVPLFWLGDKLFRLCHLRPNLKQNTAIFASACDGQIQGWKSRRQKIIL